MLIISHCRVLASSREPRLLLPWVDPTLSLLAFSLPSTFSQVGIVGGTIMTLGLGALATYTGWTIGKFKLRYPHVQNQADAGEIIGGPWLREAWGIAQILFCALRDTCRGPRRTTG